MPLRPPRILRVLRGYPSIINVIASAAKHSKGQAHDAGPGLLALLATTLLFLISVTSTVRPGAGDRGRSRVFHQYGPS